MERRGFMRACAMGCLGGAWPVLAEQSASARAYARAKLVDAAGKPILGRALPADRNLIFHYPYIATPCFLLRLGRRAESEPALQTKDAASYRWPGGIGPDRTIVAYSAICTHRLTYPTRDISFISYRAEATPSSKLARVIHCCSEHSQFDPAQGAKVLAGPAPQPLATILLEHDASTDELYAVGTLGGEMFDDFFAKYAFRLAMEHGGRERMPVEGRAVVRALDDYCRQQVRC